MFPCILLLFMHEWSWPTAIPGRNTVSLDVTLYTWVSLKHFSSNLSRQVFEYEAVIPGSKMYFLSNLPSNLSYIHSLIILVCQPFMSFLPHPFISSIILSKMNRAMSCHVFFSLLFLCRERIVPVTGPFRGRENFFSYHRIDHLYISLPINHLCGHENSQTEDQSF